MRALFQGGVCDGHSHPVGSMPPRTLDPPCRSAVHGHYIRRTADDPNEQPSTNDAIVYRWEPAVKSIHPGLLEAFRATSRPAE